jgi:hypothetical protein
MGPYYTEVLQSASGSSKKSFLGVVIYFREEGQEEVMSDLPASAVLSNSFTLK